MKDSLINICWGFIWFGLFGCFAMIVAAALGWCYLLFDFTCFVWRCFDLVWCWLFGYLTFAAGFGICCLLVLFVIWVICSLFVCILLVCVCVLCLIDYAVLICCLIACVVVVFVFVVNLVWLWCLRICGVRFLVVWWFVGLLFGFWRFEWLATLILILLV